MITNDYASTSHPGEILKELVIESLELGLTGVAQHLNVSRKTLSRVVNAKSAITPKLPPFF